MPIVFEEVTGEIAPPRTEQPSRRGDATPAREQESPLELEAKLRRQLALMAERDQRCLAD